MRPSSLAPCAVLALWGLGGCATYPPSTAISASDHGAKFSTFRIGTSVDNAANPANAPDIEFAISTGKGSDQQDLAAGQDPIRYGNSQTTFNPPQTLVHEFEVTNYDALWRRHLRRSDAAFGLEFFAGSSYLTTKLTVSSAAQRASDRLNALCFNAGLGVTWHFIPTTHLHARAIFGLPLGDINEFHRFEAHVVQALGRYASVRAGYASWRIRSEPASISGIKLNLSGPSLGLDVHF